MTEQLALFATAPVTVAAAPLPERRTAPATACGCSEAALCPDMAALWSEYAELWEHGGNVARQVAIGSAYAGHRRAAMGLTAAPSILGNCWPLMDDTYVGGTYYGRAATAGGAR
jgi:hypothetical protein